MLVVDPIGNELVFAGLVAVALLLGILLVTPIEMKKVRSNGRKSK